MSEMEPGEGSLPVREMFVHSTACTILWLFLDPKILQPPLDATFPGIVSGLAGLVVIAPSGSACYGLGQEAWGS